MGEIYIVILVRDINININDLLQYEQWRIKTEYIMNNSSGNRKSIVRI